MVGARAVSLRVCGWRAAPRRRGGLGRLVVVALAAVASPVCALSSPGSAVAAQHHPRGVFAEFADCPLSNPAVAQCIVAHITGGEFVLGKKLVPIDKTITLQGGLIHAPGPNFNAYLLTGAEDGNTLSRTALSIPGGLQGMGATTSATEVTATVELASPTTFGQVNLASLVEEQGMGLALLLKVKLDNSLLGGGCYMGGGSSPIVLELTNGTTSPPLPNRPITGSGGQRESVLEDGREVVVAGNVSLVANSFSVPAVSGCTGLVAALIDADVGLPSSAGHNAAIMNASMDLAEAPDVRASERIQP
jgi:hypothetical protein